MCGIDSVQSVTSSLALKISVCLSVVDDDSSTVGVFERSQDHLKQSQHFDKNNTINSEWLAPDTSCIIGVIAYQ